MSTVTSAQGGCVRDHSDSIRSILLADDHVVLREGLRRLLEQTDRYDVVAGVSDGAEAVRLARQLRPDIVLMDILMPGLSGLDATREIRDASAGTRVLILSVHESPQYVEDAMRSGAAGYVVKTAELTELVQAIDTVLAGRTYVSPAIAEHLVTALEASEPPPHSLLTPREREVLLLVANGASSKEIAARLGVSPRTVESHRARIMQKLGIHKAPELVRFAIREGLVAP